MIISVRLYASLVKYAPNGEKGYFSLDVTPMDVKGLIEHLGIHEYDAGMVMVNGKKAEYGDILSENDRVQILTELKGG